LEFKEDILNVIDDEARHFLMLYDRLEAHGFTYPSMPVNKNILLDLQKTKDSLLDRIAMVSLTHEAKGLDAGPRLIGKIRSGPHSEEDLQALINIVEEEKKHVEFGVKWFTTLGGADNGQERFREFIKRYQIFYDIEKVNIEDREAAGFNIDWLR